MFVCRFQICCLVVWSRPILQCLPFSICYETWLCKPCMVCVVSKDALVGFVSLCHIRCKILAAQMSWQHLINSAWIPTRAELTPLALGHHSYIHIMYYVHCSTCFGLVNILMAFNISIFSLHSAVCINANRFANSHLV